MKQCDKRKLALACKNYRLINRYKLMYKIKFINLSDANLSDANLRNADLSDANLSDANLRDANLYGADLSDADLSNSNLRNANLRNADLRNADLSNSNLCNANLRNAKINNVKFNHTTSFFALQCPEEGSFIAWKKCKHNVIVKLLIPAEARRSSATTRKCRAEFVDVLDIFGAEEGISQHDSKTIYKKGERVVCDKWDKDRWNECSGGIHFYITREEAENYEI